MNRIFVLLSLMVFSMSAKAGNPDLETAIIKLREGSIMDAREFIDKAATDASQMSNAKFWFYRANIYAAVAGTDLKANVPGAVDTGINSVIMCIALDKKEKYMEYADESQNDIGTAITLVKLASFAIDSAYKLHSKGTYGMANYYYDLVLKAFPYDKKGDIQKLVGVSRNQVRINKATVAWAAGKKQDAINMFQMLVDSNYNDVQIYQQLLQWQFDIGDTAAALRTSEKGIEQFPNNTSYFLNMQMLVYQNRNDMSALFDKLNKSIELDPTNALFISIRGSIYDRMASKIYKEKKISKEADSLNILAEKDYLKTVELDPTDTFTNFALGILYYNRAMPVRERKDNLNKSKPDYKTKLDKYNAEILEWVTKAEPFLRRAYDLKPTDIEHVDALYRVLALKGDNAGAEEMKAKREKMKK